MTNGYFKDITIWACSTKKNPKPKCIAQVFRNVTKQYLLGSSYCQGT